MMIQYDETGRFIRWASYDPLVYVAWVRAMPNGTILVYSYPSKKLH